MMQLDFTVFMAVLTAAALHAGWNAIVKIRLDPFLAMTLISVACGVLALPALFYTGLPARAASGWIAASTLLHMGYFFFLAQAYRRADMGQIYPIARGAAPLLTTLASLAFVDDPIRPAQVAGVTLLACGVLLISLRGAKLPDRLAIIYALLTAVTIALYTLVDGIGARAAGSPHAYAATLFAVEACPMLAVCLWSRGREGVKQAYGYIVPGFAGGAMSLAAYWIVIWAMSVAPIALVSATRESSVLFAGLIAVFFLKEHVTPVRVISSLLIVSGLVVMRAL